MKGQIGFLFLALACAGIVFGGIYFYHSLTKETHHYSGITNCGYKDIEIAGCLNAERREQQICNNQTLISMMMVNNTYFLETGQSVCDNMTEKICGEPC